MPIPASTLSATSTWLRVLMMGPAKIGKSCAAISTAPGSRYVIECDPGPEAALLPVRRRTKDFDYDIVRKSTARPNDPLRNNHYAWTDMMACLKSARDGVAAGKYKTIVLDTLSEFADSLEAQCAQDTFNDKAEPDGRRYWYTYEKRLRHVLNNLFLIQAHVIVTSHYIEVGGEEAIEVDGNKGTNKRGKGLVPLLGGKARGTIPSMFTDVIFMDMMSGKRVFTTGPLGVWGPGCRSFEGAMQIDADIGGLIKLFGDLEKTGSWPAKKAPMPMRPTVQATKPAAKQVAR